MSDVDFIESLNSYDVILFSETWISDKHLINLEINGFDSFHIFGHKSHGVKKGRQSGGISVYFREQYKNKISVIEKNNFGIIWLKFHHDLFRFNEDVYICHAYIPPASSKVLIDKDFDFFEEIEKGLERFSKMGKTYVTGDLNSRTGRISDILEFDEYLDSYDDTQSNSFNNGSFIPELNQLPVRQNKDHMIDHNGQKLISLCKATEHIIVNGRLHKDREGNFTFCSSHGSSVTDYLLCRMFDIDSISNFEILNWNEFSDHAPVYFTFAKHQDPISVQTKKSRIDEHILQQKIIFSEDKVPEYEEILRQNIHHLEKKTQMFQAKLKI